jgi:hypothetical protein
MYCGNKINIQLCLLRVLQLSVNLDRSLQPKFISIREKQTSDANDTPANSNQRNTAGFRGSAAGTPEKPGNAAGSPNLSIELTVVVRTEFLGE